MLAESIKNQGTAIAEKKSVCQAHYAFSAMREYLFRRGGGARQLMPLFFGSNVMIGQLSNYWWVFILLGIFAGIVSGTLGLGSGTVIVPVLVLICCFGQKSAQGTALAAMVPMALVGAVRYWRNPEIEMNAAIIALIILGSLAGVLFGTELAGRLPSHILRKVFAIFLAIVAVKMFTASPRQEQRGFDNILTNQKKVELVEHAGTKNEAEMQ